MTLASYIAEGGDPNTFHMAQVEFERETMRSGRNWATGRFEGIDEKGMAIVRRNGVNEFDWYFPLRLPTTKVRLVLKDDQPVPYDARPLTQR